MVHIFNFSSKIWDFIIT